MQQRTKALANITSRTLGSCIVLGAILIASGCARTKGSKHLSSSSYAATRKAVDALDRAGKYRRERASVFDPKFQDARQALEEVEHEVGDEPSDADAAGQVRLCLADLTAYRASFTSRETVNRPMEEQLKGLKATEVKDPSDVIATDSQEFDACLDTAKSYF